jgi:hypothetical protein
LYLKTITAVGNPILKANEQVRNTEKILKNSAIAHSKIAKFCRFLVSLRCQELLYVMNVKYIGLILFSVILRPS